MFMRPVIGVTMDWQAEGTFSKRPHYALREEYFDIIYKAGGLPFAMPYIHDAAEHYLDNISAIVVPGGDFALCSDWYVDKTEKKPFPDSKRLDFDIKIINKALERNLPLLGICAGMQILAGVSGAKLTSNISKYLDTKIDHRNAMPPDKTAHDLIVAKNTKLYDIVGREKFSVNTCHLEGVVSGAENLIISAKAEDGVIEAIERSDKDFALGLQWHPEFFLDDDNPGLLILKALVAKACL